MTMDFRRALTITLPVLLLAAGCVQVTSTTPRDACPGEQTVISGLGFGTTQGASSVTFGNVTATSVASWTDTSIKLAVPSGVAGLVNVVVHAPTGASAPVSFRAIECPVAGAVGDPRLALSPSAAPHVVVSQNGSLVYLTKTAGAWTAPETVDVLGQDYDLAVTPDGRPNVVYSEGPSNSSNQPGVHRWRDASGWSAAIPACNDDAQFPLFGECLGIRLVSPGDGTLFVFSKSGDRYGSTYVLVRHFDGTSWGGSSLVDYASVGSAYIQDDRAAAGFGTWHVTVHRNEFVFPSTTNYRITKVDPDGTDTLAVSASGDPYSTPSLAASFGRLHFVWREGSSLVHRWRDMSTGTYGAPLTITAVTGSPAPVVAADTTGNDGAFAAWIENGQVMGAVFDATTSTWKAPGVVASNAASGLVVQALAGVTHLAWRGSAGDLRYTSLP
jgi:hypothetical protein